jgi:hypothetical protein
MLGDLGLAFSFFADAGARGLSARSHFMEQIISKRVENVKQMWNLENKKQRIWTRCGTLLWFLYVCYVFCSFCVEEYMTPFNGQSTKGPRQLSLIL